MFDFFILTVWFEINNKLFMKTYENQLVADCEKAIIELAEIYDDPRVRLKYVICETTEEFSKKKKNPPWNSKKDYEKYWEK
tara:strand:- start:61 stop:303 length:243 start_codon:yes stop_codon:yes gene_type:complete